MNSYSIQDKIVNILKLGRFFFVLGGFFLFSVGAMFSVLTGAEMDIGKFLFGYLILFLGHLSVSYSNDYFDYDADKLGKKTKVSGGSGILQIDPSLKQISKLIAISLILISILLGIFFTMYYNYTWLFLSYVIFGNLLGWFYTAPPIKFAYRGLGEISTMAAIGFVVPGMGYYIMKGLIDINFFIFSIPLLIYGAFFILSVELPDMETDSISGKKNFITKNGRKVSLKIIFLASLFATIIYVLFHFAGIFDSNINFLVVSALSLVPLMFSFFGIDKYSGKESIKIAFNNLNALIAFAVLTSAYFLIIFF